MNGMDLSIFWISSPIERVVHYLDEKLPPLPFVLLFFLCLFFSGEILAAIVGRLLGKHHVDATVKALEQSVSDAKEQRTGRNKSTVSPAEKVALEKLKSYRLRHAVCTFMNTLAILIPTVLGAKYLKSNYNQGILGRLPFNPSAPVKFFTSAGLASDADDKDFGVLFITGLCQVGLRPFLKRVFADSHHTTTVVHKASRN